MIANWLAFATLVYLAGAGLHWWPGPIHFMKARFMSLKNRRSDPDFMPDDEPDDEVHEGRDEGPVTEMAGGAVRVSGGRYGLGPRPLDELLDDLEGDEDDEGEEDDPDDLAPRIDWVAAQVRLRRRATDIDRQGARLYGVTERTIAEDRRRLREQGTMGHRR